MSDHQGFIDTDEYNIIGNGSIITFNDQPLRIEVESIQHLEISAPLYLEVFFETRSQKKTRSFSFEVKDNVLELHLENYDAVVGAGNAKPIKVGYSEFTDGSAFDVYLNFRIISPVASDNNKLFFYTLYEKQVKTATSKKVSTKTRPKKVVKKKR
jgi:hypothetical protein